MSVIRKWLCLLLSLVMVLMSVNALAESAVADGKAVEYLYSFTPGNILEGEGTEMIHELLEAIRLRFYRQKTADKDMICLVLVSNDEDAFVLTAGETGGEEFALTCSLLGSNKLTLKKDQIPSFLQTLVKALGDKEILKGENLDKMNSLANRVGEIILDYLNKEPTEAPEMGIDLTPYLEIMTREATATEVREIPPEERDGSGAVTVTSYLVSQEQRKSIVNRAMDKLDRLPVIGDELRKGSLRIGQQVITDDFIRTVFADTPGEVTMDVWQAGSGQLVRMLLHLPDLLCPVSLPDKDTERKLIDIDKRKGFQNPCHRGRKKPDRNNASRQKPEQMLLHLDQRIDIHRRKCNHPEQRGDQPVDQDRLRHTDHKKRKRVKIRHLRNPDHKAPDHQDRNHILEDQRHDVSDIFRKIHTEKADRLHHIRGNRAFLHTDLDSALNIRDQQNRKQRRYDHIGQHAVRVHTAYGAVVFVQGFPEKRRRDHNDRLHDDIAIYIELVCQAFYNLRFDNI